MKFYIIGIDDNPIQHFQDHIHHIISTHTIFSGGERHHQIVSHHLPEHHQWINITPPLQNILQQYTTHPEVVIFASGDPLFFGFANTIQHQMPQAQIELYPSFNTLQQLAHRILMPYHDMHTVSLTGRPWHKFDEALINGYHKIGILTDKKEHTPSTIAQRMHQYGYTNYTMTVGEHLGNKEKEKITHWKIEDIIDQKFQFPNNIILQKTENKARPFGIPETQFQLLDGRTNMITKMPIRLLTLSQLDLRHRNQFWDIGFCTGSISIEAKMQFPHLQITAFEKREKALKLIQDNARKFGTPGIQPLIGDFLQTNISDLPPPDAVFIGGHAGQIIPMVTKITHVLNKGGTLVFNSVSPESRALFEQAINQNNLKIGQTIAIQIDHHNTIQIIKATKTL